MTLLILDCDPKADGFREGWILGEFLKMADEDSVEVQEFQSKRKLLRFLSDPDNLSYEHVHLCGHGKVYGRDSGEFQLPRGSITADGFPESCFEEMVVSLSACELGKAAFVRPFIESTGAVAVIAPQREVEFIDASLFFLNFYYLVFHHGMRPNTAYGRTIEYIGKRVRGAFQYWN